MVNDLFSEIYIRRFAKLQTSEGKRVFKLEGLQPAQLCAPTGTQTGTQTAQHGWVLKSNLSIKVYPVNNWCKQLTKV